MQLYFTAIQSHLQDHVDIALTHLNQSTSKRSIVSLGIDNLLYIRNLHSDEQKRIQLDQTKGYRCITQSRIDNSCVLGTQHGLVEEFNLQTRETGQILYKSQYKVNCIVASMSKKYLAVGTEQSKAILINMDNGKTSKCRPGHEAGVRTVVFDQKECYLASIGIDGSLIIYNITNPDQPLQMFQFKIAKLNTPQLQTLSGSFNKSLDIFYAPGTQQLQIIQLLNNKWQHRISKFVKLSQPIHLIKMIKINLMITSSINEFVIWNNRTQEKLVEIDNFGLNKIIQVGETFWAAKNDGRIFCYKKVLVEGIGNNQLQQQHHERMEIEQNNHLSLDQQLNNNADVLTFDDNQIDEEENHNDDSERNCQDEDKKSQLSYHSLQQQKRKKSKADRLITAYPQPAITPTTSIFDSTRYLYTSHHGYLIQRIQNQYDIRIQFQRQDKQTTQLLFINKKILFIDLNSMFLVYANQNQYGVKFLKTTDERMFEENQSWEKQWEDIVGVTCAWNWVAVANDQAIKVFDLLGNQIKTISFDRIIVAMSAYLNLLAVVYHQTIPIDGSQCLSMQLFVINSQSSQSIDLVSTSHVPITPKSVLKYFKFSTEGMLVSHDDAGWVRVYSLEYNTWVPVIVENVNDTRRIWVLGMKNYQLVLWKTSEINPDPQVFPRLPVKECRLGTTVAVDDQENMREYPFLMFSRFVLDHEKCRSRLWSHLKNTLKQQKYPGYKENLSTILSLKQINQNHNQLDYKFFEIIKFYLENVKTHLKALMAAKTLIRTIQAGKNLLDIFDQLKLRPLAVDLEIFFDQKEKELQYELMQKLALNNFKAQAEINIKPKQQNNPFNKKKNNNNDMSSIPSLNATQLSQSSNFDTFSQKSSGKIQKEGEMKMVNKHSILQTPQKEEFSNPFMKKKSTEEDANQKARQIEQQIEKYGIKKKVDINKRSHKQI